MGKIKTKENVGIKGVIHRFRLSGNIDEKTKIGGVAVLDMLRSYLAVPNESILRFLTDKGVLIEYAEKQNIIVTSGRSALARLLSGDNTYSGEVNYGALGTGVGPVPANGDTTLDTEVYRKLKASASFSSNEAYVDFFYAAADTDGTYTEFANFIDGTGTADTGQMFSYIATGGWVKSSAESLFVSCRYTIT